MQFDIAKQVFNYQLEMIYLKRNNTIVIFIQH